MQKLQIFKNDQFGEVRTVITGNGEPLFCLADVCKALQYNNSREALRKHVDKEDVTKCDISTPVIRMGIDSGKTKLVKASFVNESGLYSLIFGSTLPVAKVFRKWVTSEVLPAIRKTGYYAIPDNDPFLAEKIKAINAWYDDVRKAAKETGISEHSANMIMSFGAYMMSLGPEMDVTMEDLARTYGMDCASFVSLLDNARLIVRNGDQWSYFCEEDDRAEILPTTRLHTETGADNITRAVRKWTSFGRGFVYRKLIEERGVKPVDGCYAFTSTMLAEEMKRQLPR